MTAEASAVGQGAQYGVVGAERARDRAVARVEAMLDPAFLEEAGWDAPSLQLALPVDHPLLGRQVCRVPDCVSSATAAAGGICKGCRIRLERQGLGLDLAVLPVRHRLPLRGCAVVGCQRVSAAKGLCVSHRHQQRKTLKLPLEEFLADPRVVPLAGLGPCRVVACSRERRGASGPYCSAHEQRWRRHEVGQDEQQWRLVEEPVTEPGVVVLRGLAPLVVVQILFALQERTRAGRKMNDDQLRTAVKTVRRQQVVSLEDLNTAALPAFVRGYLNSFVSCLRRALADPETEKAKDVWLLAAFGHGGSLSFTKISQPWLRETAKRWAADVLPKRRGDAVGGNMRAIVGCLGHLSDSLRMRPDCGEDPAALGRADIDNFLNRLAYRESVGQIRRDARIRAVQELRTALAHMLAIGLARPGGPAAGLGRDFFFQPADVPALPERVPCRDLPPEIMQQLCDHLPSLRDFTSREVCVAVELLIDTGRRPEEICALPFDCLDRDRDGAPVLTYDNHKANRLKRRLPISEATATVIIEQQQRVRARYPGTPIAELKLLPAQQYPRQGRRAINDELVSARHRLWVDSLPTLRTVDGTEYDTDKIVPYAYRHTYAQRHADAGVAPDVLRELMDHKTLEATQRYYRVGETRRREAVDRVASMQFDRHGNRIWAQAKALLDSERARRAVGEVVVPFGVCAEPSNVKAGGHACPYRFRCVGCDHFRTDVSYLPDLQAHLDDLLRNRERLLSTGDLDTWARAEAMPSDEEITRIRRLINRVTADLDALTPQQRAQIDQAVTAVRRHRTVSLGMPRIRPPLPDTSPQPHNPAGTHQETA